MAWFRRTRPSAKLAATMKSARNGTGPRHDLFDALAHPLREQIRTGELAAGALLPSESELARGAGTKRYSIRKALLLLQNEGLIEPVVGRGWAVVDRETGGTGLLPRYRQIAAELREAMEAGLLTPGSALPSETELIAAHGVSRATVRRALAALESDGLITTHPGKGRYVRRR
jgi:DNA-binding GntR family transcriptional regulator